MTLESNEDVSIPTVPLSLILTFKMAPRKFLETQIIVLERAYKNGLRSTKMDLNDTEIACLANKTQLTVESIKIWINNRKRKDKNIPCLAAQLDHKETGQEQATTSSTVLHKAPTHHRLCGWNLFCSRAFKSGNFDFTQFTKMA